MYTLTIDDVQAQTLLHALDFYSRVGCGQFNEISRLFQFDSRTRPFGHESIITQALEAAKQQLLPLERGSSYSIRSQDVPPDYQIAYDILQVLRHCKAWCEKPEGGPFVQFDQPMRTSDHEFCTVSMGDELERLRFALAVIAQAVGVETVKCPVLDKMDSELRMMAGNAEGWDDLADAICKEVT